MTEQLTVPLTELKSVVDAATDEASIRDDYSGRYMNGRTCLGVVLPDSEVNTLMLRLGVAVGSGSLTVLDESGSAVPVEEALYALSETSEDSMGEHTIVYWPALTLESI